MANSQDLKMDTASTTSQDSFQIVDGALDRADCTANKTTSTDTVDLIKFSASEESPSDIETFCKPIRSSEATLPDANVTF